MQIRHRKGGDLGLPILLISDTPSSGGSAVRMKAMRSLVWLVGLIVLCSGCATVNTAISSSVSGGDVPGSKFLKIVVFVENDDEGRLLFEDRLVKALQGSGAKSQSSLALFNFSRTRFSPDEQARLIREREFDAALYVSVVQKALVQQPAVGVSVRNQDGNWMLCQGSVLQLCYSMPSWYAVTDGGQLVKLALTLVAKSELQDVRSTKLVWASEASVSADGADFGAMPSLFDRIAAEISAKMRADHVM